MRKAVYGTVAVAMMWGAFLHAEEPSNVKVVYEKKTVIDLTGAVIEGELTKPEGSYIVNRKVSRFSRLIRVRENFVPELLASPDAL